MGGFNFFTMGSMSINDQLMFGLMVILVLLFLLNIAAVYDTNRKYTKTKTSIHIDAQKHGTGWDEVYREWYECPNCKNDYVMFHDNYCSECGGKFEWTGHKN